MNKPALGAFGLGEIAAPMKHGAANHRFAPNRPGEAPEEFMGTLNGALEFA